MIHAPRRHRYRAGVLDETTRELLRRANLARRDGRRDAVAEAALERAFGCSRRLAVYGTLAPGRENHHELSDCAGDWSIGVVHGHLALHAYPLLTPDPAGPAVAVAVLVGDDLRDHWPRLDAFEGDDYVRVLVEVRRPDDPSTVANLYASR